MKRIPRIKFPQRHHKSTTTSSIENQTKAPTETTNPRKISTSKSDGPSSPSSTGGGKASAQPKRSPLSDKEIEAVLLGGCD